MTNGPLNGITIVDMSRVLAGPYCTMLLHDLGARVIKVEPPAGGDDSRGFGPFIEGKSAYFMSLNRGKESICLNLKRDEDREVFESLLDKADVLVENYRAGTMEKLGYGWDKLHAVWPQLIYAAISGFGQTGPYAKRAAYDMVVQAMGGIMSITGHKGAGPTRVGSSIGDITAALFASSAINAALYRREQTGAGDFIDISMLDCQLAILENAIARYEATGEIPQPLGARHPSIAPFEAIRTSDGHIIVAAGNDKLFEQLAGALGLPDLAHDARFATNAKRCENVEALKETMETVTETNTTSHWLDVIDHAGVPCGPINNVEAILNDPQIVSRQMVATIDDPVTGPIRIAGNPIKMASMADSTKRALAPELDEHRETILSSVKHPSS